MKLFWRSALNTAARFVYREHVTGQLDSARAGWALKGQRVIRVSGLPDEISDSNFKIYN
jgi:hypothetical protein